MLWETIRDAMRVHTHSVVREEGREMTYAAYLQAAERMARSLNAGEKYGILCDSELCAGMAILACFAAGAVAVPAAARYGENFAQKIIRAARLTQIIRDPGGALCVEPLPGQEADGPDDLPEDAALIMCTSGTTGLPKGAVLTSAGLCANLRDIAKYFRIHDGQRILIARPLYHCAALTGEFLIALLKGLDIVFSARAFNPAAWIRAVREENVSVLCATPTAFSKLYDLAHRHALRLPVQTAAVSGECMTQTAAHKLRALLPNTQVYHVYGLTEASPRVAYLEPELFDRCPQSVGTPVASMRARIVGEDGADVPPGTPGELIVSGPNVMAGYYRNEELTNRAIRGGYLYTGDIAVKDATGRITIRSRRDHMIIRAGMNIYPQEIESVLEADERVEQALAYGVPGEDGQRLCVKIVAAAPLTRQEAARLLMEKLSSCQMPDEILFTDHLARTCSGKLVRAV